MDRKDTTMMDPAALFSLEGKTALVTGGAQGLGRMIAEGLIAAGAKVYITSRKADICEAAAAEMGAHALPGEAGSAAGVEDIAARFAAAEDRLHILVNNAGKTWGAPIDEFPDHAWSSVMEVNVQSPFKMVQQLLPQLTAAGAPGDPARVVNIGSIAGRATTTVQAYSYAASKAAIHMLSRQLARDLIDRNISVNALLPGFFPTKMSAHLSADPANAKGLVPIGRFGTPEDIAGAVIFLSSRAGAYITGAELQLDGGLIGCA